MHRCLCQRTTLGHTRHTGNQRRPAADTGLQAEHTHLPQHTSRAAPALGQSQPGLVGARRVAWHTCSVTAFAAVQRSRNRRKDQQQQEARPLAASSFSVTVTVAPGNQQLSVSPAQRRGDVQLAGVRRASRLLLEGLVL